MQTRLLVLIFVISSLFSSAHAEIWRATKNWSPKWEKKYSKWMRSSKVHKHMFTSKKSPYYGIRADCADAAYAFRAIFAMTYKLPFRVAKPSGSRSSFRYLSNDTNRFDRAGDKYDRLVAMINLLGDSVGTEHLSLYDTFPVRIKSIDAGMVYTYKVIGGDDGKFIRHAYNIKKVTGTGEFDMIYSTQAIANAGLPMSHRKARTLVNPPRRMNWGFKRFKSPRYLGTRNSNLPSNLGYSLEQYGLAKRMSGREFFKYVKRVLKTSSDTPDKLIDRKLNSVCEESRERITYVNQGYKHHVRTGRRCMNYRDFDTYSTPSRDKTLKNMFLDVKDAVADIMRSGEDRRVDDSVMAMAKAVASGSVPNSRVARDLDQYCSIKYRSGKSVNLADLHKRLKKGMLSSHPNDGLAQRWGETTRGRTSCKRWY